MRLNNKLLNTRIKKILDELIGKGITLYRISKDTGIPNSSLKYMLKNKFEWKLNHLFALINYLKQFNEEISIDYLLNDQKYREQKTKTADDIEFIAFERGTDINLPAVNLAKELNYKSIKTRKIDSNISQSKGDSEETELLKYLYNTIKNSPVSKNSKVIVDLKILRGENEVTEELKLTIGRFKKKAKRKKKN